MRKMEEKTQPGSCWNRAKPDELVFVLLGRDPVAPHAIRVWAEERVFRGLNRPDDPKITEALRLADDMDCIRLNVGTDQQSK